MNMTKTVNGTEATIAVSGWLDTQAAPEMQAELDQLGDDIDSLVLDFSDLEFISSSGVRTVVSAYKKMNGALVVRNASGGIMNVFKETGIVKKVRFE